MANVCPTILYHFSVPFTEENFTHQRERERESSYLETIYQNMLDNIAHPPLLAPKLELVKYCSNHQPGMSRIIGK